MGYAIAEEAARRGAKVTLISGPVGLPPPAHIRLIRITSALEMHKAVMRLAASGIIVMCAAVSDYRPKSMSSRKLKKNFRSLTIRMVPNPDILMELGRRKKKGQILAGFAAETNDVLQHAHDKLRRKNLDLIVANRVGRKTGGFEDARNQATLLGADGTVLHLKLMEKSKLAKKFWDVLERIRDKIR